MVYFNTLQMSEPFPGILRWQYDISGETEIESECDCRHHSVIPFPIQEKVKEYRTRRQQQIITEVNHHRLKPVACAP
jgi:hypothetical protein